MDTMALKPSSHYWFEPWEPSIFVVLVTLVTALLYIKGGFITKPDYRQKLCFWTGLLCLYTASHTQIDYYAEHEFFIHQLQSLALHHFAPLFIVLACPKATLFAGLPATGKYMLHRISAWKPIKCMANVLFQPIVSVLLFVGLIIFWLLPSIHFIAMLDWRIYRLMNWTMAINGLMFWGSVLDSQSLNSPGCRIGMLLAVIPPQIFMGAMIFFIPHELYPIYTLCGRALTEISAISDQQIGGLILWMHGALMSGIGVMILIYQELRQPKIILNIPPM